MPVVVLLLHLFTLPTLLPMVQETKRKAMALTEAEIDELRYTRVKALKKKGYVRLQTNQGNLNLEVCPVTCARPQTFTTSLTRSTRLQIACDIVPRTSENFIGLCRKGYYNNVIFHRLIKNFMVCMRGSPVAGLTQLTG